MFHAFLRYAFGIQPLFLVVMPERCCEKTCIQDRYRFMLYRHLEQLVNASVLLDGGCSQNNTEELICNNIQKIYDMACKLNKLSNCTVNDDLKNRMTRIYDHSSSLLTACFKRKKRCSRKHSCPKSNSTTLCRIKTTILNFDLCWKHYART